MIEAINDGVVDEQGTVDRYHVTMQSEIEQLGGLVDDLFELSRIQADAVRLTLEPVVLATVSDQCGGIAERDIERVFDLAYRGDTARSPGRDGRNSDGAQPVGGGGLGLAIAKGFVEAHHGVIAVHNEVIGCTFTVCMPRWHPESVATD